MGVVLEHIKKDPLDNEAFHKYEKPVGCSIIFCNSKDELLLVKRDDIPSIPYPGQWDILGGHLEAGESPLQCIQREMDEEIETCIGIPPLFQVYNMPDRIEYTFWQKREMDLETTVLNEGQMLKWFSKEEIIGLSEKEIAFDFKLILIEFMDSHSVRD